MQFGSTRLSERSSPAMCAAVKAMGRGARGPADRTESHHAQIHVLCTSLEPNCKRNITNVPLPKITQILQPRSSFISGNLRLSFKLPLDPSIRA